MAEDAKTEKGNKSTTPIVAIVIAGLIGGMVSAGSVLGYQKYTGANKMKVVTIDIQKIMEYKKADMLNKYKGAYNEENEKKAEKDVNRFMARMKEHLLERAENQLILSSLAVIGESRDITQEVIDYAEGVNEAKEEKKLSWKWPGNEK